MSFLFDECSIYDLVNENDMTDFTCGDHDLDDFFTNDCFGYAKQVFSTDNQEKQYRHIKSEVTLSTRLMYFDLLSATKDNE